MRKLKLLFPLLGTSALAVAPALTAQANKYQKSNLSIKGLPYSKTRIETDNNSKLFLNGKTDEYYYGLGSVIHNYTEANLNFTLTPYGAKELALAEIASSAHTGQIIMTFFNTKLKHFDNLYVNSYLQEIEDRSNDNLMYNFQDLEAYGNFMNNMKQPASIVYKLVDMYKNNEKLPQVAVRFHYNFHTFATDDHDVSFTIVK